ncbi:MAG: hypothetical protein QG552_459 [Thermodesulfobacteriota bacterium]|nr:hypothetical protein [Thermodesulfobacteriota bacterium]
MTEKRALDDPVTCDSTIRNLKMPQQAVQNR